MHGGEFRRMHELSITQSIVEMVSDHADSHKVKRVTLEVGPCSPALCATLCGSASTLAAHGTALEGASLEIREIEGRALKKPMSPFARLNRRKDTSQDPPSNKKASARTMKLTKGSVIGSGSTICETP
jgi:Hydrogenase/urease nickel incorporation, metallochaperone, hypA